MEDLHKQLEPFFQEEAAYAGIDLQGESASEYYYGRQLTYWLAIVGELREEGLI